MTPEEFTEKKEEIEAGAKKQIKALSFQYAMDRSDVKEGDRIRHKITGMQILIDTIQVSISSNSLPECVYYGFVLTKAGEIRKDNSRAVIYHHAAVPVNTPATS